MVEKYANENDLCVSDTLIFDDNKINNISQHQLSIGKYPINSKMEIELITLTTVDTALSICDSQCVIVSI